ncbi:MAG: hypothetical protein LBT40_13065 [Deltaproteobacteria bacterium]|jgi:hypothetical protein|nr:hypothetical protein [Deltaproteobacteria bacterium]
MSVVAENLGRHGNPESVPAAQGPFLDTLPELPPCGEGPAELAGSALHAAGRAAASLEDFPLAEKCFRLAADAPDRPELDPTAISFLDSSLSEPVQAIVSRREPKTFAEAAALLERNAELILTWKGPDSPSCT